jgi:hypothetical protein
MTLTKCLICKKKWATYGIKSETNKEMTCCKDCKTEDMVFLNKPFCIETGCFIYPTFNYKGETKGIYCLAHLKEGMVDVVNRKCLSCDKIPIFNYPGEIRGIYCSDHSFDGMINVRKNSCKDCDTTASFGYEDDTIPSYCKKHCSDEMIDLTHRKCLKENCVSRPNYNYENEKEPLWCGQHMKEGMIFLNHLKCQKCDKIPSFNFKGFKNKLFCALHKDPGMVRVQISKCKHESGCERERRYNYKTEKTSLYCYDHKLEGMIDIYSKDYCIHPECKPIKASYNFKTEKDPKFCKQHAIEGMVDIKNKLVCQTCGKRATFNFPGTKVPIRCKKHIDPGMVDVANKKCVKENCPKTASYGYLFHTKIHCRPHSNKNEYLKIFPKCEKSKEGCKERPFYSDTNYPKRCEAHKNSNDTNIVEQRCKGCNQLDFINVNKQLCNDCYSFFVLNKGKEKEKRVGEILMANGYQFESKDKIVVDGCSKYRPDYVLDFGLLKVIVEVDENQHKSYTCECEQGRMATLHQDFGGVPVLFIRYNPDNYLDGKGRKNFISISDREKVLLDFIKGLRNRLMKNECWNTPLSIVYLFYDNYEKPEILELNYFDNKLNIKGSSEMI